MGFWSQLRGLAGAVTPNDNGPAVFNPGDPNGIEFIGEALEHRELNIPPPTVWDGWPQGWDSPSWQQVDTGLGKLVDIAWQCLDLQSNIVSAMPAYQTKGGKIVEPERWMTNPDPDIYSCWQEFAKQLFWDFQMGEAFILPYATSGGFPTRFRVMPPPLVDVDMKDGRRIYKIGRIDVTDDILHLRYSSTTTGARGIGPLEVAGAKQTQIKLLQRYANSLAETGGVPLYWIGVERRLQASEAKDLMTQWIETRTQNVGQPAILGSGATLNQSRTMDAKEMGLLEISQFSESRIAGLLGVPPFLVGLAGASGSLTYCASDDTEVLTRRGWLKCDDIILGHDYCLTLDHETGMSTWQQIEAVNTFDVVDEPMLQMESRSHSSLTTMAHRWPIVDKDSGKSRWVNSEQFGAQHKIVLAAPSADLPTEAKYTDVLVELVAWIFTEGYINTTPNRTWSTIGQSKLRNPENVAAIGHALTLMFGPARTRGDRNPERAYIRAFGDTAGWIEDHHHSNGMISFRLNHEATSWFGWEAFEGDWFDKIVSHDFLGSLTLSQLHLFIDTCIKADGSTTQGRGNQRVFVQKAGPRVDRFRYACTLAGIATSVYPKTGSDCVTVGVKKRTTYNPTFHNANPPERVTWTGRVWCPTTANGTWYARRNEREFFTGNSNIADLFDFHDRSSLRPKTRMIMESLSAWALPRGRAVELNRDDYTRLPFNERVAAYKILIELGVLTVDEVRIMERFLGSSAGAAAQALTGGEN